MAGMHQDLIDRRDLERAVLRIRLAGLALGATLLLLSPRSDQTAAAAALLGYAAAIVIQRFARARLSALPILSLLAIGVDVLYAAGLSLLLPLTVGTWALYAFAIGTGALGFGVAGAAAATAASIVAYDVVIGLRAEDLRPSDLWPVQLLLAIGLLVVELVWAVTRRDATGRRLRTYSLVQRDLIAARSEDALLDRLTDHAVRTFGARSAWIELGAGANAAVRHPRGAGLPEVRTPSSRSRSWPVDAATETHLRCTFDDDAGADAAEPAIRDIATDAAPLLVAVRERSRLSHTNISLDRVLEGVAALEQDRLTTAVIAEVLTVTNAIAGPAAVVRPGDGAIVAGDLSPHYALALVRDTTPPALVRSLANVPTGAVVAAGPGLALVTIGTRRELVPDDLRALAVLGEIAAAASARIVERDGLVERGQVLERQVAELGEEVRSRDDAIASVVHELRTPLTSVNAYAQLTSRNLQTVQQQVKQLDRLITDLLSPGGDRLVLKLDEVDLLQEAKQAAHRVTLVSSRRVNVIVAGDGPFTVRADRSRVEQVIENLLSNAVKFSPQSDDVDIHVDRGADEVVLAVIDRGVGISADEFDRIFERYYRGADQRGSVGGKGIGLAVAREIVTAHSGRIWAASDGPGKGTTVFVALPVIQPATAEHALESADGPGSRREAPHQA
jgi:signal transduction histidine kinase